MTVTVELEGLKLSLEETGTVEKEDKMGKNIEQRGLFWACLWPQDWAGLLEVHQQHTHGTGTLVQI